MSPDQKGIETRTRGQRCGSLAFTMSPDQKGIETISHDEIAPTNGSQ